MNNASRKTVLFLIEMIVAIALFSYCSAICTNIFVKSYLLSRDTRDKTQAMAIAASAAEVFKASRGDTSAVKTILNAEDENGILVVYYDKNWQKDNAQNADYKVVITISDSMGLKTAHIKVQKSASDDEIFDLEAKKYVPV